MSHTSLSRFAQQRSSHVPTRQRCSNRRHKLPRRANLAIEHLEQRQLLSAGGTVGVLGSQYVNHDVPALVATSRPGSVQHAPPSAALSHDSIGGSSVTTPCQLQMCR